MIESARCFTIFTYSFIPGRRNKKVKCNNKRGNLNNNIDDN